MAVSAVILGFAGALDGDDRPTRSANTTSSGAGMNIERIGNTMAFHDPDVVGLCGVRVRRSVNIGIRPDARRRLCATIVAQRYFFPSSLLVVGGSGLLGGAIWGVIPGILKARFNVHE